MKAPWVKVKGGYAAWVGVGPCSKCPVGGGSFDGFRGSWGRGGVKVVVGDETVDYGYVDCAVGWISFLWAFTRVFVTFRARVGIGDYIYGLAVTLIGAVAAALALVGGASAN